MWAEICRATREVAVQAEICREARRVAVQAGICREVREVDAWVRICREMREVAVRGGKVSCEVGSCRAGVDLPKPWLLVVGICCISYHFSGLLNNLVTRLKI